MRDRLVELKKKARTTQPSATSGEPSRTATSDDDALGTTVTDAPAEEPKSHKVMSFFTHKKTHSTQEAPSPIEATAPTTSANVDLEAGNDGTTPIAESTTPSPEEEAVISQKFFSDVAEIRQDLADFKTSVDHTEKLHLKILSTVSGEQSKRLSEELEDQTIKATALASRLRERLKVMEEENSNIVITNGNAELRIRQNQHASLLARFLRQMREYQTMQQKYKEKYKVRMTKQLQIIKPEATEKEVEDAISSDTGNLFGQEMLTTGRPESKIALQDLRDRHQDLLQLEKSILELHQMFVDMAVLIESQQELIDQIEANVGQATEYMSGAAKTMKKAVVLKRRARKWKIVIAIVVILIIAAIAIPVATSIAGKK